MRRLIGGGLVVFVALAIGVALWQPGPRIPEGSVLVVELSGQLAEAPSVDTLSRLTARGPALPTLLLLLEMAGADERISGVLLHIRSLNVGYARIQELRDAVLRIRGAEKLVVALLDVADHTGRIALGLEADLIVLERNPLDDIGVVQDVLMVVSDGEVIVQRGDWPGQRPVS